MTTFYGCRGQENIFAHKRLAVISSSAPPRLQPQALCRHRVTLDLISLTKNFSRAPNTKICCVHADGSEADTRLLAGRFAACCCCAFLCLRISQNVSDTERIVFTTFFSFVLGSPIQQVVGLTRFSFSLAKSVWLCGWKFCARHRVV